MMRMHMDGAMYQQWIGYLGDKMDGLSAMSAAMAGKDDDAEEAAKARAQATARTRAQFEAMKAQAARIKAMSAEVHVDADGLVLTGQTELK
jgi:hypothetical protein